MARTFIPPDLIHRPEEVERDAARFDYLCQLLEEIAFPVVQSALYRETIEAGADVLTEEAGIALRLLAEDAEILQELDENQVLQQVRQSLSNEIPLPDEEETIQHARDFSQVLTSVWLEILRRAESQKKVVILSDYLVPRVPTNKPVWPAEQLFAKTPRLPKILTDATAWFAVNEDDVATVMRTLRTKIFPEPQVFDLPFDLVMAGTPRKSAIVLSRESLDRLIKAMRLFSEEEKETSDAPATEPFDRSASPGTFATPTAQVALRALSEPLPAAQYSCLERVAFPKWQEESIEARVQAALTQ